MSLTGKGQLGTVRKDQKRYKEALTAYQQAREQFNRLDEPASVAAVWHQTGKVYQDMGQPEAAEDAYRQSLAINVRLGNIAGQAGTLNQLGNLYDDVLSRTEEAISFYRLAADKYVEISDQAKEGVIRNNLADTLRKLHRFTEARQEIKRAIECGASFGHASQPWTAWDILADIETVDGNPTAAAESRAHAIAAFLSYRRDGGENHTGLGRFVFEVNSLSLNHGTAAASLLMDFAVHPHLPPQARPFIQALQAIADGNRNLALADNAELNYLMAAKMILLIETEVS